jgi:hypothetical protein
MLFRMPLKERETIVIRTTAPYGFRGVDEGSDDLVAQQSLPKLAYFCSGFSSYVPVRSW